MDGRRQGRERLEYGQSGSREWGVFDSHHTDVGLVLYIHSKSDGAGVVSELLVPDHRTKTHEGLPAIGQDHHETRPQVKIIPDWNVVLKAKLCGNWIKVLNILHVEVSLGVGKFMNVVGIGLRHKDAQLCTDCGLTLHTEYALDRIHILVVKSEFEPG